MRAFIGIDVGSVGCAVALMEDGTYDILRFGKSTDKDIWEWLNAKTFSYDCVACVEKVWAMPAKNPDGTMRSMGAQTMFQFGENNGMVKAFITAAGIPVTFPVPQTWQKIYGLKKEKGEGQPDFKRRLRERAEQLYPHVKFTLDTVDGFLIAHFCKTINK